MNSAYVIMFYGLLFIVTGLISWKIPPKSINYVIGYRTKRSTRNNDTWFYANRLFGKRCLIIGLIYLPLAFLHQYIFGFYNHAALNRSSLAFVVLLVGVILSVEISLEKKFPSKKTSR